MPLSRCGSLKKLPVNQPVLSMQTQKREEEVKLISFSRSGKPPGPASNGRLFVEREKKIIARLRGILFAKSPGGNRQ